MDPLIIEEARDTPQVIMDPENNRFELNGRSLPENSTDFYHPIFLWFEDYIKAPNDVTTLKINMFYFNTSSSKMVLDLLFRLEDLKNAGHEVNIEWYCDDDDEDMIEMGEEFAEMVEVPLEIKYNEED